MAAPAENELDILFPNRQLLVGGEEVTVREFTYLEALRLGAKALPLLIAMEEAGRDTPDLLLLDRLLPQYVDIWFDLLAVATGRDTDWLKALGNRDGERLMLTFWAVNQDFFVRRIALLRLVAGSAAAEAASKKGDPSA